MHHRCRRAQATGFADGAEGMQISQLHVHAQDVLRRERESDLKRNYCPDEKDSHSAVPISSRQLSCASTWLQKGHIWHRFEDFPARGWPAWRSRFPSRHMHKRLGRRGISTTTAWVAVRRRSSRTATASTWPGIGRITIAWSGTAG